MSGHTPGPWRYYAESSRGWCVNAPDFGIACTSEEADARLIAAAPDLLVNARAASTHLRAVLALPGGHIADGAREDIFQVASWLTEAADKAEGNS